MLTIYNTTVLVTSQEQADRLKQACVDNKLKIHLGKRAFDYSEKEQNYFYFYYKGFSVGWFDSEPFESIITESEWMELLTKNKK